MRERGIDYFENSRRATLAQQRYAIANPHGFRDYNERCWGLTATDGPGPRVLTIDGVKRRFYDYIARGVPDGPDDGTLAPWAVVASLPFAPEIVVPTVEYYRDHMQLHAKNPYGFKATFNATYPDRGKSPYGWISPYHYGINQGPIVVMPSAPAIAMTLSETASSGMAILRTVGCLRSLLPGYTRARAKRSANGGPQETPPTSTKRPSV